MIPKQKEMDDIVQQIYTAMETKTHLQSTLLVLCGDHGMNEGGNHGGSAPGETSTALVFVSPKLRRISSGVSCPVKATKDFEYYTKVEQSDLAPTLAGLLGFPVPLNNLGVFIPRFLELWPMGILCTTPSLVAVADICLGEDKIQLMLRNALQMLEIVKATFPHPLYEDSAVSPTCTGSLTNTESLACKWKDVVDSQGTLRSPLSSSERALDVLHTVSCT